MAKVAAAAAATSFSSVLPSVAVTPMAQSHRLKKALSESSSGKSDSSIFKEYVTSRPPNVVENSVQLSLVQNSPSNGVSFNVPGGVQNIKILKSKDHVEMNGSEIRPVQHVLLAAGNGTNSDKNDFGSSQQKGSNHWRVSASVAGKQQGRYFSIHLSELHLFWYFYDSNHILLPLYYHCYWSSCQDNWCCYKF